MRLIIRIFKDSGKWLEDINIDDMPDEEQYNLHEYIIDRFSNRPAFMEILENYGHGETRPIRLIMKQDFKNV